MEYLNPIEFNNERILTTEQLAEAYETDIKNIQMNFSNHKVKFIEGKHYYLLQGEELRQFKNEVNNIGLVGKNASSLYLWTERGANRHCKILDTDKAWEQFDNLEETYFKVKDLKASFEELSPQLQLLIKMETSIKTLETHQAVTDKKIENISGIVALNSDDWRKTTGEIISKISYYLAGTAEEIRNIRNEIYEEINERFSVNLKIRLTNKKRRMAEEGIAKSRRDKLSIVDVIAEDKKLIEAYVAIVKEKAITYGLHNDIKEA